MNSILPRGRLQEGHALDGHPTQRSQENLRAKGYGLVENSPQQTFGQDLTGQTRELMIRSITVGSFAGLAP
jgi:hypothetical protein